MSFGQLGGELKEKPAEISHLGDCVEILFLERRMPIDLDGTVGSHWLVVRALRAAMGNL